METDKPITRKTLLKGLLKTIYIIHLVVSAIYSAYIIVKYPEVVSLSITFIMIVIYGYMGVWVLLIGFMLVVNRIKFSYANITKKQQYLVESL
jgi:hypothetical protein